ncbi:TRAP transporter small permease [uncultured Cohaesibacter sp.]|uniref:TRAP transporter small permease n=1 Tax=uncultured Cohaesibacter sp. TaxID=1002546 RepID=UPI0029C98DA4|nr:TRAP transporter small permease [uncultured Cohaesibacter sp.]
MFASLKKVRAVLDQLLLSLCGVIIILLVAAVSWQVFSRYILNDPSTFTDEIARFMMIWLGLLGASFLFGKNGHLAITLLSDSLSPKLQAALQTLIGILVVLFAYLAMFSGGITLMGRTMFQISPALGIPMGYVYGILPISACLICFYVLLNIIDLLFPHKGAEASNNPSAKEE